MKVHLGAVVVDGSMRLALHFGETLPLGPRAVAILFALAARPGEAISREELLDTVWPDEFVEEGNLTQHVYLLRKVLAPLFDGPIIETISRRGYRYVGPRPVPICNETSIPRSGAGAPDRGAPARRASWAAIACIVGLLTFPLSSVRPNPLSSIGASDARTARYYLALRSRESLAKSIHYFERVTLSDPRSAVGYAGIATADVLLAQYGYAVDPKGSLRAAHHFADEAQRRDPQSAEANLASGLLDGQRMTTRNRAAAEFQVALRAAPDDALAHHWYGTYLAQEGDLGAAGREFQTALQLEPMSVSTLSWLLGLAYTSGNRGDAREYAARLRDLAPMHGDLLYLESMVDLADGRNAQAIHRLMRLRAVCRCRLAEASLAYAHIRSAQRARGAALLATFTPARTVDAAEAVNVAAAYLALGRRRYARTWLLRADGLGLTPLLRADPRLDAVRHDHAFWFVDHQLVTRAENSA